MIKRLQRATAVAQSAVCKVAVAPKIAAAAIQAFAPAVIVIAQAACRQKSIRRSRSLAMGLAMRLMDAATREKPPKQRLVAAKVAK
ncbi:MAG: hypothetical protein ACK449_01665 [Planctomycetota bacterium]